jgi:hypothetical protein
MLAAPVDGVRIDDAEILLGGLNTLGRLIDG